MTLLYAAPELGEAAGLAELVNSTSLTRGGRGRSSVAYKLEGQRLVSALGADAARRSFCVKRVTTEDQVAPHDVMLEMRLLKRMQGENVRLCIPFFYVLVQRPRLTFMMAGPPITCCGRMARGYSDYERLPFDGLV